MNLNEGEVRRVETSEPLPRDDPLRPGCAGESRPGPDVRLSTAADTLAHAEGAHPRREFSRTSVERAPCAMHHQPARRIDTPCSSLTRTPYLGTGGWTAPSATCVNGHADTGG